MAVAALLKEKQEEKHEAPTLAAQREVVRLRTNKPTQFVDLTDLIGERVRRSEVRTGLVSIQVLHTTAAVLVNENEPRLIDDLTQALERMAPRAIRYAHDDFERRESDAFENERCNGHAHCKALTLAPSLTLHVDDRRIQLGPHQRVFLVELDGARPRGISIMVLGLKSYEGHQ